MNERACEVSHREFGACRTHRDDAVVAEHSVVAEHCITCGDVAVELRVVRVDEARQLALCETDDGERETVEVALVAPVGPDERLLVHAGTAIARAGDRT